MRRSFVTALLVLPLAACSGGGGTAPAPKPSAAPVAAFQPSSITVHATDYDYFGVFEYSAAGNAQPKPIAPADGSMTCNDGFTVAFQIRSGPVSLGLVRDQYVVLPLLTSPPAGTTLTCTSEWGIFTADGTLLASDTLNATVVYDATSAAVAFVPSTATVKASGGNSPIYIDYTNATGFTVAPITPADGTLSCPGGYAPTTQVRAGPGKAGLVQEQLVVNTASIAPPAGTSLACKTTWGLYDSTQTLVEKASLAVTLDY